MGSTGSLALFLNDSRSTSGVVSLWRSSSADQGTKVWKNATASIDVRKGPFNIYFSARAYGAGWFYYIDLLFVFG